jgi:hypothetical protein
VRRGLIPLLLLLALAPGGCGGDDEAPAKPTKARELTVPRATETHPEAAATTPTTQRQQQQQPHQPQPAPAPQGDASGGAPAPQTQPQDSPQYDTPPPKGSPAERFEKFCDENPGACG